MSRFDALNATLAVALLTTLMMGVGTLQPTAAHAKGTAAIAQGGGASGAAIGTNRTVAGGDLSPQWFGKFWKQFKKIFSALIDFIDRVVDTTVELLVDGNPDGSVRPDRWSPTRPEFPPHFPLA
ncbi:MAG TPA: hypothetical protein VF720_09755 [Candidatus Eisenbacteria bacterium]